MWMDYKEYISCFDAEIHEGYMYLCDNMMNAIFRMDMRSLKTEFIGRYDKELLDALLLCRRVKKHNDKLIFFPGNADSIAIFDISSGKMECKSIKERIPDSRFLKVIGYVEHDEHVLMIPALFQNMLVDYDLTSGSIKETVDWPAVFLNDILNENGLSPEYISSCFNFLDISMFRLDYSDYWIRKDWKNNTSELVRMDTPKSGLMFSKGANGCVYGIERGKRDIFKYNDCDRSMKPLTYKISGISTDIKGWHMIIEAGNQTFLLDDSQSALYEYLPKDNKANFISGIEKDEMTFGDYRAKWPLYWGYRVLEEKLYLFPYGASRMTIIDLVDGKTEYVDIRIEKQELKRINTELKFRIGQVAMEDTNDSLATLLRYVLNSDF